MDMPKVVTKNQLRAYAVIAFNNFLHSGNITNFNVKDIEIFIDGAMEAHNKSDVVKFVETLKENNKDKNYKIEIKY